MDVFCILLLIIIATILVLIVGITMSRSKEKIISTVERMVVVILLATVEEMFTIGNIISRIPPSVPGTLWNI